MIVVPLAGTPWGDGAVGAFVGVPVITTRPSAEPGGRNGHVLSSLGGLLLTRQAMRSGSKRNSRCSAGPPRSGATAPSTASSWPVHTAVPAETAPGTALAGMGVHWFVAGS